MEEFGFVDRSIMTKASEFVSIGCVVKTEKFSPTGDLKFSKERRETLINEVALASLPSVGGPASQPPPSRRRSFSQNIVKEMKTAFGMSKKKPDKDEGALLYQKIIE